jgi:hypothetical protein
VGVDEGDAGYAVGALLGLVEGSGRGGGHVPQPVLLLLLLLLVFLVVVHVCPAGLRMASAGEVCGLGELSEGRIKGALRAEVE